MSDESGSALVSAPECTTLEMLQSLKCKHVLLCSRSLLRLLRSATFEVYSLTEFATISQDEGSHIW